jgi:O-methyltransferase involved in polyketide biosynthesis
MTEKIAVELGNVQKTLFLPLWGRAEESRKTRALLVDKTALEIMEKVDYDFTTISQKTSPLTQAAWIIRSLIVDEVVRAYLVDCPQGTVVNIGCGLDTTFERVDNGRLRWYDLDMPDVIALRRKFIPESERRQFIASSFLEEPWLQEIQAEGRVLFIAAGVFYYFLEDQVSGFLTRLADKFPGAEVIFDVCSPQGLRVANRVVIRSSGLDAKSDLQWGLESPQSLLGWDERFRLLHTYYYFGKRARRLPLRLRLYGLLSDAMKIQYMLHLGL